MAVLICLIGSPDATEVSIEIKSSTPIVYRWWIFDDTLKFENF